MPLECSTCCHCGRDFKAADSDSVYSIKILPDTHRLEIITGLLIEGSMHYCSDTCMFMRKQHTVSYAQYVAGKGE